MNELLLHKVDGLLREHAAMRCELELYRRLFDALIETEPDATQPGDQARWAYRQTPEADRAVERVLDYRYRATLDAPAEPNAHPEPRPLRFQVELLTPA